MYVYSVQAISLEQYTCWEIGQADRHTVTISTLVHLNLLIRTQRKHEK